MHICVCVCTLEQSPEGAFVVMNYPWTLCAVARELLFPLVGEVAGRYVQGKWVGLDRPTCIAGLEMGGAVHRRAGSFPLCPRGKGWLWNCLQSVTLLSAAWLPHLHQLQKRC